MPTYNSDKTRRPYQLVRELHNVVQLEAHGLELLDQLAQLGPVKIRHFSSFDPCKKVKGLKCRLSRKSVFTERIREIIAFTKILSIDIDGSTVNKFSANPRQDPKSVGGKFKFRRSINEEKKKKQIQISKTFSFNQMGSQKLLSALESDALSVIQLLNEETNVLDRNKLSELFDSREQKCKQVLDVLYVSVRLNRFSTTFHLALAA
jgi:hypothetical protein